MNLWISDCNASPPAWISSASIRSLPDDLYVSFNFAIAISTSKGLWWGTNSSAVCISTCLPTFNNWEKSLYYNEEEKWGNNVLCYTKTVKNSFMQYTDFKMFQIYV
jgi:hypothetical protein